MRLWPVVRYGLSADEKASTYIKTENMSEEEIASYENIVMSIKVWAKKP